MAGGVTGVSGGGGNSAGGGVGEDDDSGVDAAAQAAAAEAARRAARLAELNDATPEQVQQVTQSFTPQTRFESASDDPFSPLAGRKDCNPDVDPACGGLAPRAPGPMDELYPIPNDPKHAV